MRSIENQNMSEIEIILINDYSKDNSLKLIKKLQKHDPRIIIINNKKNMGTLYSRSIGVLNAKGKYIFSLDNDDMFFNTDVFDVVYKIAENGNFDIVKFKKYYIEKKIFNLNKIERINLKQKNDIILHQPDLGIYPIVKKGKFAHHDYIIWDKCIRADIYKKSVNKLRKDLYNNIISWNEDIIIIYIIFNLAKSFKIINKLGIIHIISNSSASFTQTPDNKIFCDIFFLNTIFEFSNENKNKNYAVDYLIKNKRFNYKFMNNKNKIYLLFILDKMINSKYIIENNKNYIKQKIKKITIMKNY